MQSASHLTKLYSLLLFCVLYRRALTSKDTLVQAMGNFGLDASLVEDVQRLVGPIRPQATTSVAPEEIEITHTAAGSLETADEVSEGEEDDDEWEKDSDVDEVEHMGALGDKLTNEAAEWDSLVRKHIKLPETALEKERYEFYNQIEYDSFQNIQNEDDLKNFKQARYIKCFFFFS